MIRNENTKETIICILYDNKHLITECDFLFVSENFENTIFLSVKRSFVTAKSDGETFNKIHSFRYIDRVRHMNNSVDSVADNLTRSLHNTKCKYCMKYKDCKKPFKRSVKCLKMLSLNYAKRVNTG